MPYPTDTEISPTPSTAPLEFGAVASPEVATTLEAIYQRDIGTGVGEIVAGQTIQTPEQQARFYAALAERRSLA